LSTASEEDPDQPNRFNTHASAPLQSEVPAEEGVSQAQADGQLEVEPEEARNATGPEGGPQRPRMS
jgi:hypothetical protein